MLSMAKINDIKYLKQVQGFSYRKVMKITGHSYGTIRKYEEIENFNYIPIKRTKKTFKIDQYKEFVDKWLLSDIGKPHKQRHTAKKIYAKNRLLKQAKFDVFKTFDDYDFSEVDFPETIGSQELKELSFILRQENLIFYGPVGTGKTHLATAIGVEACNIGKKVRFFKVANLVNELIEAYEKSELRKYMSSLKKYDLLICDEWGYIPLETKGAELLFQVIADCYERKSLIITTNLEFGKWNNIFLDKKLTAAIIDRIIHHSHLITFSGESYRLKNSIINSD